MRIIKVFYLFSNDFFLQFVRMMDIENNGKKLFFESSDCCCLSFFWSSNFKTRIDINTEIDCNLCIVDFIFWMRDNMIIVKIFLYIIGISGVFSAPAHHHQHSKKSNDNESNLDGFVKNRKLIQDMNGQRSQYNNAFGQPNYPYGTNNQNGGFMNNNGYPNQMNGQYQVYDQNGYNHQAGFGVTPNPLYPNQPGYNQQGYPYYYYTTEAPFPFNLFQPKYTSPPPPFPFNLFMPTTQAPSFPFNLFQSTQAPLPFPLNIFGKK